MRWARVLARGRPAVHGFSGASRALPVPAASVRTPPRLVPASRAATCPGLTPRLYTSAHCPLSPPPQCFSAPAGSTLPWNGVQSYCTPSTGIGAASLGSRVPLSQSSGWQQRAPRLSHETICHSTPTALEGGGRIRTHVCADLFPWVQGAPSVVLGPGKGVCPGLSQTDEDAALSALLLAVLPRAAVSSTPLFSGRRGALRDCGRSGGSGEEY